MIDEFDYDPNDMGIQRNYTGRTAQATDQPVTPDREAMIEAVKSGVAVLWDNGNQYEQAEAEAVVDALLPLLTEALDRARQQGKREGREEAAQAIDESLTTPWDWFDHELDAVRTCAALARGGPNRKDEE